MTPKQLTIKTLRQVAKMHFNGTLPAKYKQAGLCFAVGYVNEDRYNDATYETISAMCKPYLGRGAAYLAPRGKKWDQRAMFALLLAESQS